MGEGNGNAGGIYQDKSCDKSIMKQRRRTPKEGKREMKNEQEGECGVGSGSEDGSTI